MATMAMTKAEAGRLGGRKTATTHGSEYMRALGLKGATAFWKKYKLVPVSTNNFAIINRATEQVVGYTNGRR